MASAGELTVTIKGDNSSLKKSVGESDSKLKSFSSSAVKSLSNVALAVASAGAAMAGLGVAIVKSSSESARELVNLSQVANTTTSELQAMAYASNQLGIDQSKLSDILKDVNDKVGDFFTSGAGGMVDFFEKVAPKVGVTADQFRNLSGPQALQLYVSTLEKANLSQAELTYHLEAIASDATALLPLFRDNGAALQAMTNDAREMGIVLSDIEIQQLSDANKTFSDMSAVVGAVTDRIAIQLAPIVEVLGQKLVEASKESDGFKGAAITAFSATARAAGFVGDAFRGIHVIVKGLEVAFRGMAYGTVRVLANLSEGIDNTINAAIGSVNTLIDGMNSIPGVDLSLIDQTSSETTDRMKALADALKVDLNQALRETHDLLMRPLPSDVAKDFIEGVQEASERQAEIEVARREKQLGINQEYDQKDAEQRMSRFEMLQAIEQQGQDGLTEAMRLAAERRDQVAKQEAAARMQVASGMFGNLSSLMNTENRRLFEIGKAAAIAQATISGYESVVNAYNFGTRTGGPYLGAAFAATAGIATAVQIANIKSTQFGGAGGGASSFSGGQPAVNTQQAGGAQQGSPNVSISLEGGDMFSREQVVGLIGRINEAVGDGVQLRAN